MVYHELMTDPASPIIHFYPRDFELDMNGKKMEWEAVVKIPLIDERRLLDAMKPKDELLTEDQRARNEFGVTLKFSYSPEVDFTYPSSLIGVFLDVAHCHCVVNIFELPTMDGLEVLVGLLDGVQIGQAALAGSPSLKTLPQIGALAFHGVNVFQQDSRNESMIVTLTDSEARIKVEAAKTNLARRVVRVSDELFDYMLPGSANGPVVPVPHGPHDIEQWRKKA
ncbi:MAG: 5'-3' exoribonuclease 1 [Thelocarpon impressellum]|nr:MAG: 5'-3' exoribonuclease 1 [Thelocarpon impressellum]